MSKETKRKLRVNVIHRAGEYFAEVVEISNPAPWTPQQAMPDAAPWAPKRQDVIYAIELEVEEIAPRVTRGIAGNP